MNFNKINIREINGLCPWFKNRNCVIRIPTFKTKILMGFQIITVIFYCVIPFIFILVMMSNATRNARNEGDKIMAAGCLVLPILIFYFLLTYKKVFIPIVKSWRNSRRYAVNPLNSFLDPRRPVLLLRSFLSDREENKVGRIIQRTPEEDLVAALSVIGPVITAGQPGEEGLPLLGASRVYFEQDWDKNIVKLCKIANVIVIDASNTKSLAWEMLCVRNLIHPRRVLISFLNKQDSIDHKTEILETKKSFEQFYRSFSHTFQNSFETALPDFDSNTFFVQFDDKWKPYPIRFSSDTKDHSSSTKYVSVNSLLQGLSSFFSNLEILNNIQKVKS